MVVRSYDDELQYLERISPHCWRIKKGFQPNMKVEGVFYVNSHLEKLMLEELRNACRPGQVGGFLPGVKQIANVAALPGIVGASIGLPDIHSGYGFAIGNVPVDCRVEIVRFKASVELLTVQTYGVGDGLVLLPVQLLAGHKLYMIGPKLPLLFCATGRLRCRALPGAGQPQQGRGRAGLGGRAVLPGGGERRE